MNFDHNLISDSPGYEKLYKIPAVYYKTWLEKNGGTFTGKKVLDFGCGGGEASAGLSLFCGVESVLGVDIGTDFSQCDLMLKQIDPRLSIPQNVSFETVPPASSLGEAEFDVIVSWSVMEHVSQDVFDQQVKVIFDALKPGGYCVFQIAPLYYSPFGSHLFNIHDPWGHLSTQLDLLETKIIKEVPEKDVVSNLWGCFITLNKFTASEFVRRFSNVGLEVIDTYETYVKDIPSEQLCDVFCRDVLTKEQILMVCRKAMA
jgi:SAM-dependent methyltransferase